MKGRIIFGALLFLFVLGWHNPLAAKDNRVEVGRFATWTIVPATPAPVGACAGTFVHCVVLSWGAPSADVNGNAIAGPLTYDVYRSNVTGTGYAKITTSPTSSLSFEDDAVVGGRTYFYVVVAYQTVNGVAIGPSANSVEVNATGLPIPGVTNPPQTPAAVSH